MWPITSDIKTQANACGKHKRFSRTTNQQIAFKTQLQWKGQFSMSVKLGYCGIWNSFFISALATRHSYITCVMWQKAKCALHTNKSDDILNGREHIKKKRMRARWKCNIHSISRHVSIRFGYSNHFWHSNEKTHFFIYLPSFSIIRKKMDINVFNIFIAIRFWFEIEPIEACGKKDLKWIFMLN